MRILQDPRLKKLALTLKPWAIFIVIFFFLKVTGLGTEISVLTQSALLKAGVMDVNPESTTAKEQTFSYDFTVRDLDGKKLNMKDLKGKVIFLNLWATWCGPCKMMNPILQELKSAVGEEVVIIKIDVEKNHEVASALEIQGVPTLMIFQRGELKWRQSGVVSASVLEQVLQQYKAAG